MVALSEQEMALCATEAAREDLAVGAWLGQVGVHRASGRTLPEDLVHSWAAVMQALMVTRAQLMENRRLLRNVGGNLNDVARYANATGRLPAHAAHVLALVGCAVEHIDADTAVIAHHMDTVRQRRSDPAPMHANDHGAALNPSAPVTVPSQTTPRTGAEHGC